MMRWCSSCILPDTRPNLSITDDGVCNACHAHEAKDFVDWEARTSEFKSLVKYATDQSRGNYDCLIPVSGGKDSTWQVVTCLDAGLRVLALTWRPPGRTAIGQKNLDNLISLGVDHVDFSVSPAIEKRFMLETLTKAGSPAIPMHLALFNLPLNFAIRFQIPLIVWGENSAAEYGSPDGEDSGSDLDARWLRRYGVSAGTSAKDWVSENLKEKELIPYFGPSPHAIKEAQLRSVFLGHYFPWDPETTRNAATARGFQASDNPRTGFYNYADIDDTFISVHHWFKWFKFGFTRLFDNLSLEIRNGRLSRDEAVDIVKQSGEERPEDDIKELCGFLGITADHFRSIEDSMRNPNVWSKNTHGTWFIPNFLTSDWEWK